MKMNGSLTLALVLGWLASQGAAASSPLADAAQNNDTRSVRALLRDTVDVNAGQTDGMTALHWAVYNDNVDMIELLLAAGADVSQPNRTGATPLYIAAAVSRAAATAALLAAGADPNSVLTAEEESWLMLTAATGSSEAVAALLAAGADPNARQIRGQTALMWAASEGHTEVIRMLVAAGAEVNLASVTAGRPERRPAGGFSALVFAARQGHVEAAQALLELGADPNITSADGTSPMLIAIVNGHYPLAHLLLDHGADPSLADEKGRAPLYAVIDLRNQQWSQGPAPELPQDEHMAMIRHLVENGANLEQALTDQIEHRGSFDMRWTEMEGGTPFLRAAWNGDHEVMRYLLEQGADPLVMTAKNETALLLAAGSGWPLGQGHIRSDAEIMAAMQLLVEELGMDVNAVNADGLTPLMGAVFKGTNNVAEYLIEHGAQLDAEDNDGRSVFRWTLGVAANMGQPPRAQPESEALIRAALEARGLEVTIGSGDLPAGY